MRPDKANGERSGVQGEQSGLNLCREQMVMSPSDKWEYHGEELGKAPGAALSQDFILAITETSLKPTPTCSETALERLTHVF